MYDAVKGGDFLSDQDAAEVLAKDALMPIYELKHMGAPFNQTVDGTIAQRAVGGHTRDFGQSPIKRVWHTADRIERVF
jgi:succinate dehydrogenase / fumarate reductase flavoprotein subunit